GAKFRTTGPRTRLGLVAAARSLFENEHPLVFQQRRRNPVVAHHHRSSQARSLSRTGSRRRKPLFQERNASWSDPALQRSRRSTNLSCTRAKGPHRQSLAV